MISDRSFSSLKVSGTSRALRFIPAWLVSLGVHALLCVCLVFGIDGSGIPDGSGADEKPLHLSARFTSIAITEESPRGSQVEFITDDETAPQQPPPLVAADSRESRPASQDFEAAAVATVSRTAETIVEEGPATPLPQTETSHVGSSDQPSTRRPQGTASYFAALLSASSRFPDNHAADDHLKQMAEVGATEQQVGQLDGARFFNVRAQGEQFCYVVDCSSSMEDENAIAIARAELNASLRRLESSKQFQILFYDSELHPMVRGSREVFFANDTNRRLARQFMSSQQPNNRALHRPALLAALRSNPDVIFLLTDGQLPELSARDLYDLKTSNKRRIQINVIEFGKGAQLGTNWLEQLARDHRGMYRYEDITERPKL